MTRDELEHAIRAVCDVTGETEVYVFGSQAVLGQFPNAPALLRQSAEVDVALKNVPELSDLVDGMLGELSEFHRTNRFYVHGLTLESAVLPRGWEARAISVKNENTANNVGICVEAHDLAASKLAANRDKDRQFARVLLLDNLIRPNKLVRSLNLLPIEAPRRTALIQWVDRTWIDIQS